MIKIEKQDIVGWEPALRGMRNAMESWDKSDSIFEDSYDGRENILQYHDITEEHYVCDLDDPEINWGEWEGDNFRMGPNDLELAQNLAFNGGSHSKYRRMVVVYADITAPLYWWKEYDTYKVGTVANSCSTMHKIHARELTLDDFSCEHLFDIDYEPQTVDEAYEAGAYEADHAFDPYGLTPEEIDGWVEYQDATDLMKQIIFALNVYREQYLETKDKKYWWQMIQLLQASYNQKRTVMLNYEVLSHIYHDRKNHKLDEWRDFCHWIETLPYAKELIIGEV